MGDYAVLQPTMPNPWLLPCSTLATTCMLGVARTREKELQGVSRVDGGLMQDAFDRVALLSKENGET